MTIRTLCPNDFTQVDILMHQLHQLHLDARPDLFIPLEHPLTEEQFLSQLQSEDNIWLGAEVDRNIIGICLVTIRHRTCMVDGLSAYIDNLCVDQAFRDCGIGRALFVQAEKYAKEKGASRLDLMVWGFNEAAQRWYESLGMTPQRYIFEKNL